MASERKFQSEVPRTFHRLGGDAFKTNDIGHALRGIQIAKGLPVTVSHGPGSGKPDYTWLLPPRGGYLEVKGADSNFSFSEISDKQRYWLTYGPPEAEIVWPGWKDVNFLWLFMGTARVGASENGRRAWMIPWRDWLKFELQCWEAGLKGLAYSMPHKLEHREAGLSACELLRQYEVYWNHGAWDIHMDHPFWRHYFYPGA